MQSHADPSVHPQARGKSRARRFWALVLVALFSVSALAACNKYSSPTTPYGGGGGGAGTSGGTSFGLGPFAVGQSATLTFTNAGSFGYHCIPHQSMGMTGTVQVDAAGADSMVVQIGATGLNFTPVIAHIKPGGRVRWVNASNFTNHTVTSD